jgi:chromate transporter
LVHCSTAVMDFFLILYIQMLLEFFLTCNKIGAFTLGGGYAMIPIMEREFVDKHQWMDRQEFMDIMVVAQTTPGIFAIDMASHIGYKLRGVWGGIVGALGIALPSIIAIMVIAMFFQNFKDNEYVAKFFRGVRPAVVALIAAPCFKMAKTANITWRTAWIPVVCAALIWLLGVSPIYIIIAAGLAGYLYGMLNSKLEK